ncbi:MAG: site-specific integrase [Bifidobacterium sp.]|jgi:integrase|nr:site-specific integrase [Bifidobacterium sp.]
MASIESYSLKDGSKRYRVRYRKPDHSSTDKRGFKTKHDARLWSGKNDIAIDDGSYTDPKKSSITIGALYTEWYELHSAEWSESWKNTIQISWRVHVKPQWGSVRLNRVTYISVQHWVNSLRKERSASTVLKAYNILRSIIADAIENKRIARTPLSKIELPKKPKKKAKRNYLKAAQVIAFANECGKAQEMGRERRALILVLGFCGLRWGEAAGLLVGDIDFNTHRITVQHNIVKVNSTHVHKDPKSEQVREVPIPDIVQDALKEICKGKDDEDNVFLDPSGKPIRSQSVGDLKNNRTWYVSALKRLGYKPSKMPSPHDLRHSAASIAVSAGANVKALQTMLGHSSAAMTLDVYADLFDDDLDKIAVSINKIIEKCG